MRGDFHGPSGDNMILQKQSDVRRHEMFFSTGTIKDFTVGGSSKHVYMVTHILTDCSNKMNQRLSSDLATGRAALGHICCH